MINIILFIVFLHNGLSDHLASRNFNSFSFDSVIIRGGFSKIRQLYDFFISFLDIDVNVLILHDWLNVSLLNDISSRSFNQLSSNSVSNNRVSEYGFFVLDQRVLFFKLNFLNIIDDFILKDGLVVGLFCRGLVCLLDNFFSELSWLDDFWLIFFVRRTSAYIQLFGDGVSVGFYVSFSECFSTGNRDLDLFVNSRCIEHLRSYFLFSVNWSPNLSSFKDRNLDYSLFDDRFRDDFFSENGLTHDFSLYSLFIDHHFSGLLD